MLCEVHTFQVASWPGQPPPVGLLVKCSLWDSNPGSFGILGGFTDDRLSTELLGRYALRMCAHRHAVFLHYAEAYCHVIFHITPVAPHPRSI